MGRFRSSMIQGIFAAAVSAAPLAAEPSFHYVYGNPQSTDVDKHLNQQKYIFSQRELGKGDFITEGAVLDEAIGVLCEWRERADLDRTESGTVISADVREFDARCMPADQTPAVWVVAGKDKDAYFSSASEYGLIQSRKKPDLVLEWSNSIELGSFIRTSSLRSVDLDKGEVCLDVTKSHLVGLTTYQQYTRHRLGCFPLQGEAGKYADRLMRHLKMQAL